jgi:hypothetical protein
MLGILLAVLALIAGAGAQQPARNPPERAGPRDCIRANVAGRIVCLAAGLPCQPRGERSYRFYGYTCRNARGRRYVLRQRTYIGSPLPSR